MTHFPHFTVTLRRASRAAVLIAVATLVMFACKNEQSKPKKPATNPNLTEADVQKACGLQCHRMPPPDVMWKSRWRKAITKMCEDVLKEDGVVNGINIEDCIHWYEKVAPDTMTVSNADYTPGTGPVQLKRFHMYCAEYPKRSMSGGIAETISPCVANVTWAKLRSTDKNPKLITCDMLSGAITVFDPAHPSVKARVIAQLQNPAHATVIDLDKDGIPDILIADMGTFAPSQKEIGSVELLHGKADGTYDQIQLIPNLARATDVEAADFDGDGDLDLVVTCFGLTQVGETIYAENQTTDWVNPRFKTRMLDPRPGGIHCPVVDLNNDGKPDFVTLVAQQYETILAFTNKGGGQFKTDTIWIGPHPHWGSSGIQMVDMDGDGDLDVLYTNGDVMDDNILQPYHGIQWLENKGTYPYTLHALTHFNGCERAVAVDLDGDGDVDILASSFLPKEPVEGRKKQNLESLIWLENKGGGVFARHNIEMFNTGHASIAVTDYDGDGRPDIAAGNFCLGPGAYDMDPQPIVTIWHNDTKAKFATPVKTIGMLR